MTHYVVLFDYALTDYGNSVTYNGVEVTGVVHSLEEAKEILANASVGEREYATEHEWTICIDTDSEFVACEKDNYDNEHAHFYIQEIK